MVAKERAVQLNSGVEPTINPDNDKNTVISLREIAAESIKTKNLRRFSNLQTKKKRTSERGQA